MDNRRVASARVRRHLGALSLLLATVLVSSLLFAAPTHAVSPDKAKSPVQSSAGPRIKPEFFGIDLSINPLGPTTWPGFGLGAVRVATPWSSIERTKGVYDWAALDVKVATAEEHGTVPLIVLEGTPKFHALDATPTYASPPDPSAYRRFVRALVARYGARADYHVWNEANVVNFFTGTPAQMAAMTKIVGKAVRKLAPTATVVAPSFPLRGDSDAFRVWFKQYWSQKIKGRPVGSFVDVAAVSAYPMPNEDPEDSLLLTEFAHRVLKKNNFKGPLWATEINYGASGLATTIAPIPMKRQVSYVVRTFVLHASAGTQRVYWWRWEKHQTVNTAVQDGQGTLTPAGEAFGVVESWLLGTRPTGCKSRKGVRTCGFRVDKDTTRYVSWTRSGRVRTVVTPDGATTKTNPAGVTKAIKPGRKLRVGLTPVMVEVKRSR